MWQAPQVLKVLLRLMVSYPLPPLIFARFERRLLVDFVPPNDWQESGNQKWNHKNHHYCCQFNLHYIYWELHILHYIFSEITERSLKIPSCDLSFSTDCSFSRVVHTTSVKTKNLKFLGHLPYSYPRLPGSNTSSKRFITLKVHND